MPVIETESRKDLVEIENVTIRFAGDSGDGMQLTGTQFTNTSAVVGNDISTLPDFPAEIRAPAGSLPGVSGFQLNFCLIFELSATSDGGSPSRRLDSLTGKSIPVTFRATSRTCLTEYP